MRIDTRGALTRRRAVVDEDDAMVHDTELRCLGFTRVPAGDGLDAISFEGAVSAVLVPSTVAQALGELVTFRPLEGHARAIAGRLGGGPFVREIPALLRRLRDDGALISGGEVSSAARTALRSHGRTLDALAFLTHDRPTELARALRSYVANARSFEREIAVTVADDGASEASRGATRAMLQAARAELGVPIQLVDETAKRRYVEELADVARVPRELLRFALFDDDGCGEPIGANRNALLLAHAGVAFLSADDDTLAVPAAHPRREEAVRFVAGEPTDWWYYPDRAAAYAAHPPAPLDVLAEHERGLYATVPEAFARGTVDLRGAFTELLRALLAEDASVAVTLNGVYGDSGAFAAVGHLGFEGDSRARMVESARSYAHATRSREAMRVAPAPTVGFGVPCMGTCLAFDHRPHVPFFPVLRNEDGIFGATTSTCAPGRLFLHLPFALRHEAASARRPEVGAVAAAQVVRQCDVMVTTILAHRVPPTFGAEGRWRALAVHLQTLGAAPLRAYRQHVRDAACTALAHRIARLQRLLETTGARPSYWADDVRAHVEGLRATMTRPDGFVPQDLGAGRGEGEAWSTSQTLMRRYGELLEVWPRIVDGARALRLAGRRPGLLR